MNIGSGLSSLILTLILIRPFGLVGVALGVTIPRILFDYLLQPVYACKSLGISVGRFFVYNVLHDMIVISVFVGGVFVVTHRFVVPSYPVIFSVGLCSCIAFIPYILLVGFSKIQRESILLAVIPNGVLRRRKGRARIGHAAVAEAEV